MNFLRSSLDQPGGGHWSPFVGSAADGGRWMVLDVAKYKEQYNYFLNTEGLYNAVDNVDGCGVWGWGEGKQKGLSEEERAGYITEDVMEKLGCVGHKRGIILMYKDG